MGWAAVGHFLRCTYFLATVGNMQENPGALAHVLWKDGAAEKFRDALTPLVGNFLMHGSLTSCSSAQEQEVQVR